MAEKIGPLPAAYSRMDIVESFPLPNPISILLDPTSICNFRCQFCPTGDRDLIKQSGRDQGFLKMPLYDRILDEIAEFERPVEVLRLYKDGEPLLHPHFIELVRKAKQVANIKRVETTTNGSKLSPAFSDELIAAGIDRIVISIEGVSAAKYKSFAGVTIDFDNFVDNIRYLHQISGDCQIHVKTVAENLAEGEAEQFKDIFLPICDRLDIEHTVASWPNFNIAYIPVEQLSSRNAYGNEIDKKQVCSYLFYSISINSDGSVSPCCVDWDRKLVIGDLNTQSIQQVWQEQALHQLRLTHLTQGRQAVDTCRSCGQIDACMMDNIDNRADVLLDKLQHITTTK